MHLAASSPLRLVPNVSNGFSHRIAGAALYRATHSGAC